MRDDVMKEEKPKYTGAYHVFGTVNKGSKHEAETQFVAYWENNLDAFVDQQGEDLTGINDGVKYWFDFSLIPDPV